MISIPDNATHKEKRAAYQQELDETKLLLAKAERQITELAPKHEKEPWADHRHPDGMRDMEDLRLWRGNCERYIEDLQRRIHTENENIAFEEGEAEGERKAAARINELEEQLRNERNPPCGVCAGDRVLLTGEPCTICSQTGLESEEIIGLRKECLRLEREAERLRAELNTPQTADFLEAVRIEAAHQRERWGVEHDAGKCDSDWFWLIGYLAGKVLRPGQTLEKRLHHIITTAAVCLNWHAHATGADTRMRPGIEPPAALEGGSDV